MSLLFCLYVSYANLGNIDFKYLPDGDHVYAIMEICYFLFLSSFLFIIGVLKITLMTSRNNNRVEPLLRLSGHLRDLHKCFVKIAKCLLTINI